MPQQNTDGPDAVGVSELAYNIKVEPMDQDDARDQDDKATDSSSFMYEVPVIIKSEPAEINITIKHETPSETDSNPSGLTSHVEVERVLPLEIVKIKENDNKSGVVGDRNGRPIPQEKPEEFPPTKVKKKRVLKKRVERLKKDTLDKLDINCEINKKDLIEKKEPKNVATITPDVAKKKKPGKKTSLERNLTGSTRYQCEQCKKYYSDNSALRKHIRTHSGEKPFKCNVCQKGFGTKGNLESHIRIHTGEKPYQCSVCDKSFTAKGNLDNHFRVHTGEKPFKCHVCEKCFSDRSHLNTHIRIHTGEKPYQCKICNKSFIEKSHLNPHMRKHTGEKPFQCFICKNYFITRSNLNRHIRLHTEGSLD